MTDDARRSLVEEFDALDADFGSPDAVLAFRELLGVVPDHEIATKAGVTQVHVTKTRRALKIPSWRANGNEPPRERDGAGGFLPVRR